MESRQVEIEWLEPSLTKEDKAYLKYLASLKEELLNPFYRVIGEFPKIPEKKSRMVHVVER